MSNELMGQNGIMELPKYDIQPVYSLSQAIERREQMIGFVKLIMVDGVDYGTIPGTDKPTLLKPGAEKLLSFFGISVKLFCEKIEDWDGTEHGGEPLFSYTYRACAFRGSLLIAEADGNANSRESKYRWRWVNEADVPHGMNREKLAKRGGTIREPLFAIDKAETSGRFGKPAEYWQAFKDAIASGTARQVAIPKRNSNETMEGYEIDAAVYRIPNEDLASQINTIQKMGQKRAIVAVALLAVNASEFFTQDIEDFADLTPASAPKPVESRAAVADAIKQILQDASEPCKLRIEAVRDAIFGARRRDANSWALDEMIALRDTALQIVQQDAHAAQAPTTTSPVVPLSAPAGAVEPKKSKAKEQPAPAPSAPADPPTDGPVPLTEEEKAEILREEAKAAATATVVDEDEDPFA